MKWLKWHIGSVNDPKFTVVARKSGQPKAVVLAVWAYLLEGAADRAGNVSGLDLEDLAAGLDVSVQAANAIWLALVDKGLIDGEVIAAWGKRQSVDVSTERVRKYREKRNAEVTVETVSPAPETTETAEETRLDKTRLDQKEESKEVGACAPDLNAALHAYNRVAERTGLAIAQRLTEQRRKSLRARLAECGGQDGWLLAMAKLENSPFLLGKTGGGWRADFDFVLQSKSFTKLMEGGYDQSKTRREATLEALDRMAGDAEEAA